MNSISEDFSWPPGWLKAATGRAFPLRLPALIAATQIKRKRNIHATNFMRFILYLLKLTVVSMRLTFMQTNPAYFYFMGAPPPWTRRLSGSGTKVFGSYHE